MNSNKQKQKFITLITNLANKENILLLMTMALTDFSFSYLSKTDWLKPRLTALNNTAVNKIFFMVSICYSGYKFEVVADDKETKDFIDIAKSITSLKVFTTTDKEVAAAMGNDVTNYLKSSKLSELMRFSDQEAQIKFYVLEGRDDSHVKELLMFVSGVSKFEDIDINGKTIETVLLSLSGDIDLNKINALITKMNLPQELNKVNQKQKI